jgi:cephalosporin-C deacetylase
MPSIDMPLEQMRQYKPTLYREADFDAYWESTVNEALSQPLTAELIPYVLPARGLQCYAVRFDGKAGASPAGTSVRHRAGSSPGW